MNAVDLQLALVIGQQLAQTALNWQTKLAAGTITPADVDAALVQVGASRADLVAAIAERKSGA